MCEKNMQNSNPAELNDDELEQVAGGAENGDLEVLKCSECKEKVNHIYRDGDWYCTVCGKKHCPVLVVFIVVK